MEHYKSIDTLPIWNYSKIIETDNLIYLIRSDEYDFEFVKTEEEAIWDKISKQYIEATSHRTENKRFSMLNRNILELTIKKDVVENLCFILSIDFENAKAKELLSNLGYKAKTKDDLEAILKRNKNLNTLIREKQLQIENEFGKQPLNTSFEAVVDRISDAKHRELDPRKITVKRWIAIEDNYVEQIRKQNAANQQERRSKR